MGAYLPFIVWLIAIAICSWIAHKRNVRETLWRRLVVIFLGPLAIPLMFLYKPEDRQPEQGIDP